MAVLTISAVTLDDYRLGGSAVKLRIQPDSDFVTSLGKPVERGPAWYREITCSISSRVDGSGVTIPTLTIPAFTIDSTRDALVNAEARYTGYFYVDGTNRGVYIADFSLPATFSTGTTGTWDEVIRFNSNILGPIRDHAPYTRDELLRIIATIPASAGVDASASVKGSSKLSVAPASASNPIAVGDNDPRVAALGTANQVSGMNAAGTLPEYKSLALGTSGADASIAHTAGLVTLNLPSASSTARGLVSTGTQSFVGAKTFDNSVVFEGGFVADDEVTFDASVNFPGNAQITDAGIFSQHTGANVASAASIIPTGNVFTITGTTTISTIVTTDIVTGTVLYMITTSALTFDEAGNIDVTGATSLVTSANQLVIGVWDSVKWRLR